MASTPPGGRPAIPAIHSADTPFSWLAVRQLVRGLQVFTPAKRLFGRASAASEPLVGDYHVIGRTTPVAPHAPGWQEDLDSLFNLVDAQMVERRGIVAALPPHATPSHRAEDRVSARPAAARTEPGHEPVQPWIGFGLADEPAGAVAPADLLASIDEALARALASGWSDSVKDELREMIRLAVREAVSDALRDAITLAREDRSTASGAPAAGASDRPVAPRALVSIRVRRPLLPRRPSGRSRASRSQLAGPLGLRPT